MENYNKKARDVYRKYLKDKRVVIVGPSPSILKTGQGKFIDDFDVVVRLNKALPIPTHLMQDIGKRTDVLYNCMNPSGECGGKLSVDMLKKSRVQFLVGAYPAVDRMGDTNLRLKRDLNDFYNSKGNLDDIVFCYFDNIAYFHKLWDEMKLPNTGIMAILDLLKHDIKELYLTGLTFFKGGYYSEYRQYNENEVFKFMKRMDLHDPPKQLYFMTQRLLNSQRCILDAPLREILENEVKNDPSLQKLVDLNTKEEKQEKPEKKTEPVFIIEPIREFNQEELEALIQYRVSIYT
jgi:Glycosyltransferase family 29 (sialyltransferase)